MKKFILSIIILFSLHTLSFAQQSIQPITDVQAIEIARQDAIARGYPPDWFGGAVLVRFDGNQWIVYFDGKQGLIGDNFSVRVSPEGEVLGVIPGR